MANVWLSSPMQSANIFANLVVIIRFGTMVRQDKDSERDKRITYEIIVDCYDEHEQMMGWYYYLENHLYCPFTAKCVVDRSMSPLKLNEAVKVIGLADEDDCESEIFVMIEFMKRDLAVPLMQLQPVNAEITTLEAVEDWQYWVNQGNIF